MSRSRTAQTIRKLFGFAVKRRREALGLTQEEVAERAGLHWTYQSDIERGTRNLSLINIERVALALSLKISETAFQEFESSLHGEIHTLGSPKAALIAFRLALAAYNPMSAVKAPLRCVHGEEADDTKVSGSDLAEKVAGTHRGMMIAVPKDEWVVFNEMSPRELNPFPKRVVGFVRLSEFRKQP